MKGRRRRRTEVTDRIPDSDARADDEAKPELEEASEGCKDARRPGHDRARRHLHHAGCRRKT
eukprot:2061234-Rhodomonas_salina.1